MCFILINAKKFEKLQNKTFFYLLFIPGRKITNNKFLMNYLYEQSSSYLRRNILGNRKRGRGRDVFGDLWLSFKFAT